MGLGDGELRMVEDTLLKNPKLGDVIEGTGGARKIRFQLAGRGKRGGGRIIYLDVYERESIHMLFAYPKNLQSDLTAEQKKIVRRLVEQIHKEG
jgi:hypothetical protein